MKNLGKKIFYLGSEAGKDKYIVYDEEDLTNQFNTIYDKLKLKNSDEIFLQWCKIWTQTKYFKKTYYNKILKMVRKKYNNTKAEIFLQPLLLRNFWSGVLLGLLERNIDILSICEKIKRTVN